MNLAILYRQSDRSRIPDLDSICDFDHDRDNIPISAFSSSGRQITKSRKSASCHRKPDNTRLKWRLKEVRVLDERQHEVPTMSSSYKDAQPKERTKTTEHVTSICYFSSNRGDD